MKRYDLELTATGPVMEERKEGAFVPFSEVDLLKHHINQYQEERSSTGMAISNAILSGIVPEQHPLRSRLELLANHHKREQALAELLREARNPLITAMEVSTEDELTAIEELIDRIDVLLVGKLPDHIERLFGMVPDGWQLVPVKPTEAMLDEFDAIVDFGAEDSADAWRRMLASAPKPEPSKGRTITEEQEFELITALQSIVTGFSDDPAHDAAALLKRITGEVPWTGDSFQLPPRQGGESCATEPRSSSQD